MINTRYRDLGNKVWYSVFTAEAVWKLLKVSDHQSAYDAFW